MIFNFSNVNVGEKGHLEFGISQQNDKTNNIFISSVCNKVWNHRDAAKASANMTGYVTITCSEFVLE